jgi:hypothetical protein
MSAHFEYPSGLNQNDVMDFLNAKGVPGRWIEWNLNVFGLLDNYTMEEYIVMSDLCKTGFEIKGVPVRGHVIAPSPPKLVRE